jgi:hypothetical protein
MKVIIKTIPDNIKKDINGKTILDFGSGIAAGTIELLKVFKDSKITAVDFSETAVEINKRDFPQIDSQQEIKEAHTIISSNVIEHTDSSKDFLEKMAKYATNYIIILAPSKEDVGEAHGEHVISISEKDFPEKLGKFKKVFEKTDVVTSYWMFDQILVIYKIEE